MPNIETVFACQGTKNKRGENYAEIVKENAAFEGYYKVT